MLRGRVLVVDDEPGIRSGLRRFLEAKGYEVLEAGDCAAAEGACASSSPDVAIVDQRLPDGNGVDLLARLKGLCPSLSVIMLTAHGSIDLAVRAIKEGAEQFLTKPLDLQAVLVLLDRMVEDRRARQKQIAGRARADRPPLDPFLGASRGIRQLAEEARRARETDCPVLIQGETGTGKGVLARWLHDTGPRREEAFVDLNCAALSPELLESELFGHEAGAFTGASRRKQGLLEVADRGSVFLDEIGDMGAAIQARVLKVLEEKRFRRVGDVRDRHVDVRLIAATHRDLGQLLGQARFREDLYYRISTLPLVIPPLRERREDLAVLARTILERSSPARSARSFDLSEEALAELQAYPWPGNIRELRNVLERAALVCDGRVIRPGDFRFVAVPGPVEAAADVPTLADLEERHVRRVLELERGHVARAARRLGVATSSLYARMRRYGIPLSHS